MDKFKMIVSYVVQVYFSIFFDIKVKHSIVDGPYHILKLLRLFNQQPDKVRDATAKYIRSGSWFAHPEAIILTMLSNKDREEREFAVDRVMEIRAGSEKGDESVRPRKTPNINLETTTLRGLIDWEKETLYEPIFTCSLSLNDLDGLRGTPFSCPYYCNHTQSTERAVQQVTQAAESVCGPEKRDGYVRARIDHREIISSLKSKKE